MRLNTEMERLLTADALLLIKYSKYPLQVGAYVLSSWVG